MAARGRLLSDDGAPAPAGRRLRYTMTGGAAERRGRVISGSMNVFAVECNSTKRVYRCVIKGKVIKVNEAYYNPVCPGDMVRFTLPPSAAAAASAGADAPTGQLVAIEPRRNVFSRYNEKGRKPQLLAANAGQVVVVASVSHPPFRPRFIDRVLIQCEKAGIPAIVALNKSDLPDGLGETAERLSVFAAMGYAVFKVSAKTGAGLDALADALAGKTSVLTGQSGAGKSTLVNALFGTRTQKTGGLTAKYDRGAHTTVMASLLEGSLVFGGGGGAAVIDTPGLRQFIPDSVTADELIFYMRDIAPFAAGCRFGASCAHTSEPGCGVLAALAGGNIHPDRWNTYITLRETLAKQRER